MVSMDQLNASFGHKERANSVMSVTNTLVEGSLSYFVCSLALHSHVQVTHVIYSFSFAFVLCVLDVTCPVFYPQYKNQLFD